MQNALYIDKHSGSRVRGVIIFGGDGINYEQPSPGSSFLQDLWILSIGKNTVHGLTEHSSIVEYTHSWTRISEDSDAPSGNNAVTTSVPTPSLWPKSRWNFGYTTTEEGWFLIYGGEDATNNVHYDDTWVFFHNKWLQLQVFYEPRTGLGPGRRKGASLLLLPLSGLVVLWGGQRPPIGGGKRPVEISEVIDIQEDEAVRNGRSRGKGPYVQCLSDTYIFNATAAIKRIIPNDYISHSKSYAHEHLHLEDWRRATDFPGACLCGAEAVGVLDPVDGREKLFAFGGRYRANSISTLGSIRGSESGYLLSDNIWMYDPLSGMWSVIEKDLNHPINWPEGRDKHAMAYVAELNTVFVSGGRLADPVEPSGDVDDVATIDIVDMDLWGFDLTSRRWSQYGDSFSSDDDSYLDDSEDTNGDGDNSGSNNENSDEDTTNNVNVHVQVAVGGGSVTGVSGNNKWWVGVAGDLPAARYQHGLSVWRGVEGTERPFLVCFGGERSDTPWDLKQGSNLRTSNVRERVSTGSDQTAIDDDFFTGTGSGGSDNDNGGILGPISSHAQSNDLWLFPLPAGNAVETFYDGDTKTPESMKAYDSSKGRRRHVERVLSGGADSSNKGSGRRGRINGGNSPRHRMPPRRHNNGSSSDQNDNNNNNDSNSTKTDSGTGTGTGSGDKIPHGTGNGTAGVNITDPSVDEAYGWTLLSAGGCHYLDDGRYETLTHMKLIFVPSIVKSTFKCTSYFHITHIYIVEFMLSYSTVTLPSLEILIDGLTYVLLLTSQILLIS
jgi:hypothetical protein